MGHGPIRRHPSLQPLSRDHNAGLRQARLLRKAADGSAEDRRAAAAAFADAWRQEIADHFADEERLLLDLMSPSDRERLLAEHATLRALAGEAAAGPADPDPEWMRTLGRTLHDHIRWEERELFPAVERAATPEQLAAIGAETDAITRPSARPHGA